MNRRIRGVGTPEATWGRWQGLRDLPRLDLGQAPASVLVVAPHPDDEVLGAGGLLALLAARGAHVTVLALSDGECAYGRADRRLGARRVAETQEALRRLLGFMPNVDRLALPDGRLASHGEAIAAGAERHIGARTWCLLPHRWDGHPDHEAATAAVATVARARGARLLEYPIWLWHWSEPGAPTVGWERARRIDLPFACVARKREALAAFASQLEPGPAGRGPILPPHVLERFVRSWEVVFA